MLSPSLLYSFSYILPPIESCNVTDTILTFHILSHGLFKNTNVMSQSFLNIFHVFHSIKPPKQSLIQSSRSCLIIDNQLYQRQCYILYENYYMGWISPWNDWPGTYCDPTLLFGCPDISSWIWIKNDYFWNNFLPGIYMHNICLFIT